MDVIVVTGDRDSYQLVRDPHIRVLYNKRGRVRLRAVRRSGHLQSGPGVTPTQYPEYAALRGDPERQPARRSRHRREDRGQARQRIRRRWRGSSSISTTCRRSSARTWGSGATRSSTTGRCRCSSATSPSMSRWTTCDHRWLGPGDRAGAVRPARVPDPVPAPARGLRRRPTTRRRPTSRRSMSRSSG